MHCYRIAHLIKMELLLDLTLPKIYLKRVQMVKAMSVNATQSEPIIKKILVLYNKSRPGIIYMKKVGRV